MKPPVVHQPVQPPAPSGADADAPDNAQPASQRPGLVGSDGPLVTGPGPDDQDGAGADERKRP